MVVVRPSQHQTNLTEEEKKIKKNKKKSQNDS